MNEDLEERLSKLRDECKKHVSGISNRLKYSLLGLGAAGLFAVGVIVGPRIFTQTPTLTTYLPSPSPTLEAVVESPTPSPSQTRISIPTPTYTTIPTDTPTPTSTPMPTYTPMVTPLPTTPIPTTATATPGYKYSAPELYSPEPWEHFRDANDGIVLEWGSVGQLEEDEYYEIRIKTWLYTWVTDLVPECQFLLTKDLTWEKPLNWRRWVEVEKVSCYINYPNAYRWGVHVVKVENGKVVQELSPMNWSVFNWSP